MHRENGKCTTSAWLSWIVVGLSATFLLWLAALAAAGTRVEIMIINVVILVWTFVAGSNRTHTAKELALLHGGFLFNFIIMTPSIFYGTVGDPPEQRPYANEVVNAAGIVFLMMLAWLIVAAFLMRKRWYQQVAIGCYQAWLGLLTVFTNAGVVTGAWL